MYIPKSFLETDPARARDLVEAHSFATLIVPHDAGVEIVHVPFLLDRDGDFGALRTHIARANPIAALLNDRPRDVVVVFAGPHAYVTPRWYTTPRAQVPTWNYAAVHVHGVTRVLSREESERTLVDVSARFEGDAREPWTLAALDPKIKESLVPAIVAFRIEVTRVEAKLKLSQNKDREERARVIAGLRDRDGAGDAALAALMEANERPRD